MVQKEKKINKKLN